MRRERMRVALPLLALAGMAVGVAACGRSGPALPTSAPVPGYAPALQGLLETKLGLLTGLAEDPAIREAAKAASRAHAELAAPGIARLDARWRRRGGPDEPLGNALQTSAAADRLMEFRDRNRGFPEVFLTDRQGLVAAMTNPTSDYAQADEDWWQRAYADGRGAAGAGEIEYDASAHTQAIALHVPVYAAPGGPVVGVIKALYDVDAIKGEL